MIPPSRSGLSSAPLRTPLDFESAPIRSVTGMSDNSATAQRPIGSGFGARSTAGDVLRGVGLTGRLALVTGGCSGLGLETARTPPRLRAGGAGRPGERRGCPSWTSAAWRARAFADRFPASVRTPDIVIGSAGIMACPQARVGPGREAQFATDHLGHFALVNRLWPAVEPGGARVVSVSSRGHHASGIRGERGYDEWEAYGRAKTAGVLFAVHLDRLARDRGVRAFSLHPGGALTPLQRHLPRQEMVDRGWIDEQGNPLNPEGFKTPQQGAATRVWAAASARLDGMGGLCLEDCDVAGPDRSDDARTGVEDWAVDPEQAARLRELSARLTDVNAFA